MPNGGSPFLKFSTLADGQSVQLGNVRLTPVSVDHVIPCFGFLIEDDQAAIAFVSDTAPTQNIWDRIRNVENLKAVFLEASFPNALQQLADKSMHLTPHDFAGEVDKIGRDVSVIAIHLKSRFRETIVEELKSLGLAQLEIGKPGHTYQF
jgi:ribonuclease BN (tRNA processing enzyme)